jgi:hypothetical protein
MSTAALVLVCALNLLGRSPQKFPPFELLEVTPPGVSANAEAFVRRDPDVIYLITTAPVYRAAQAAQEGHGYCRGRESLAKIASIIVHEEWHLRYGPDERGAYEAQLTALAALGFRQGTGVHSSVTRSMLSVLDTHARAVADRRLVPGP